MHNKLRQISRNLAYALASNLIALLVSALVILFLPDAMSADAFGYFQLYLFYVTYVGVLHLGWVDGIYLRYGGRVFDELDSRVFSGQFRGFVLFQLLAAGMLWILAGWWTAGPERRLVLQMVGLVMVLANTRDFLLYLMQATNRIEIYAKVMIIDRLVYLGLIIGCLLAGAEGFSTFILSDLTGKGLGMAAAIVMGRQLILKRRDKRTAVVKEAAENIRAGVKLMAATVAGMMIIGIVRFGIERTWDIATFGRISLTLYVSNVMMVLVNAMGTVLYPILRRVDGADLSRWYRPMRTVVTAGLYGLLLVYWPIRFVLERWLTGYEESLRYMAILFPMVVYEGRMALLVNTYLKAQRREKQLLAVNVAVLLVSMAITGLVTGMMPNLNAAVVSILLLLILRVTLAEQVMLRAMGTPSMGGQAVESALTCLFVGAGWWLSGWSGMLVYGAGLLAYLGLKRQVFKAMAVQLKQTGNRA